MDVKLPYYMVYPSPFPTEGEEFKTTDLEYLRNLYPCAAKIIFSFVSDECDRMECAGSVIFDMYPDKVTLLNIRDRVRERISKETDLMADTLTDLIEVMLYEEIYKRRREYFRAARNLF